MISKSKVSKELIWAPALFYLICFFTVLQAIINFCQSVRRHIKCCNPHRFFKSRDFSAEKQYSVNNNYIVLWLSMLGTPFLSVQKIATKMIKEQIFRRKSIISCVSLGELEELNSGFLKIIVILQQDTFTERHESKILTFSFTFFCWLQLKIICEQDLWFCSFKINSLSLSQKGWENSVLASKVEALPPLQSDTFVGYELLAGCFKETERFI